MVQLTNNSVLITDAQGHIEWVNPAFTRLSGYSLEEARGRNAAELRRIETTDPVAFATIRFATEQGQNVRLQAHYHSRDGQDYWLDLDIQLLRAKQGQITGSMAIETDITAEKRAGETLEVALNETAALMNTINIHSIVSETDVAGRILHANHAFEVISGYTRDELIGQNHRIVNSGVHPPEFWKNMWKTISSGEPWRGEVCNRTKDGELYWVDNVIAPFLDGRGRITKYVSVRTDITASKRYQASLQEARAKAEEATRSKGQFLANMSHEIRTPMNAILGMLSLLQKTKLDSRQADYANKTEGAARSLLGLLNDILDFSKVEAGKMTLDLQPFRLDRLLRDLSVILSSNVGAKNVEVLFDIDPTVPKLLLGDALRLQQVLINLGGNAVKFTAQGQVVISIRRPTVAAPPDTLVFAVQDSGIGIAPENQAHIFSGFSQAEASTSRRFGGTGLGLAISQRLVEVMGGQLQLHSVLGEGSTFSFAIALPPVEASTDALQLPPPVSVAPRHVLVVDDNAVAGELMVAMARSWNWTADLVSGGEDAIAYVRAKLADGAPGAPLPCQVVFLDWHMAPGLDGWETARQIRSLCQAHATPPPALIMVTGQGRETLSQRTEEEQSWLHGFLVKPVTASMLLDAVLDADAPRSTVRQDTVRASQRRLNGLRLLVVEDNLINQQVAEELLNSEGAQVSLAANGQLGVEAVLAAHPQFDAVLMDVQMPVLDGYAATRALRTDAALANLPIIAMTANAMATDREACLQAGMNDHIGKPFDLNELVALLQRFVDLPTADATASLDGRPPLHEALPPTPGVDLQVALARLSGNRSLYLRTAHDFLRTRTTAVAALEQALQAGEFGQATLQLHTLKGIAGTLGLTALAQTAGHLEKRCPQEAWQAAADFATELGALADTLQADCAALQAAMSHLQPASAHDAPHPAALADADVPASRARVQAALAALLPLLAHEDFEVLERFAELQPDLQGLTPSELEPLETALQNLEWQEAYVLCQALISRND
ncbi:MAG: hybrid sensor histidine kinase/response regulator [Burkholderiales bacterium PBB4]|nr:MAG: hybrid sensor histidine kinase/response regulator [Burkholderiales bacterium PBB4]